MAQVIELLETGPLQVNCILLGDTDRGEALLIDPGGEADRLLRHLARHKLQLTAILATHGHFDHIGAVADLQAATGAPFHIHPADRPVVEGAVSHAARWGLPFGAIPRIDGELTDGQTLELAGFRLEVRHTPGHTPGGVCFLWDQMVAVGDTLFAQSVGRTDLPGGDHPQLLNSIHSRLLTLEDTVECLPGHGPTTTIGRERRHNPFLID